MADLISIVVPVYNGADSLEELYQGVKDLFELKNLEFELILVDDYSSDNSYAKILELHQRDSSIKGIKLARNFGQQNAIFCGFNYASGNYIITMDDDLQHQARDIIRLYQKIKEGYDAVYAIPRQRKYSFYRQLGSKLTDLLFKFITGKDDLIKVSSFRIINHQLKEKILNTNKSFIYISAIILKEEVEIANIYTEREKRRYGDSNYNFIKLLKLFLKLYIYYGNFNFLKYLRSNKKQYLISEKTF